MRRAAAFAAALAAAAGSQAALAAPPGGMVMGTKGPLIRILDDDPVTLRGAGFRATEHVTVVVTAGKRVQARAVAGAGGVFTLRLAGVHTSACKAFSVLALGDDGSRATYKRAPGMCAEP